MMNHEYIIPMTDQAREIYLSPLNGGLDGGNGQLLEGISRTGPTTSLKPQMHSSSPCFVSGDGIEEEVVVERACIDSPEIPLDILKNLTLDMLTAGVQAVSQSVRDPAGGNVELLLVPLLRLLYSLLVMGVFGDEDLGKVLRLMDPSMFSIKQEDDATDDEQEANGGDKEHEAMKQGLLQMKLPEAVKLEVNHSANFNSGIFLFFFFFGCYFVWAADAVKLIIREYIAHFSFQLCHLLSYLTDCQVRHRVEAVIAFSDNFVHQLQENQRLRYTEVMQALNMSAALTARRTKEFRLPPQEQVERIKIKLCIMHYCT